MLHRRYNRKPNITPPGTRQTQVQMADLEK
jgi:hypothetical protein